MSQEPLTLGSQFTVKENKVMAIVLGILFLALFSYGLVDAVLRRFKDIDYQSYIFALAVIPALMCFRRARNNKVYIRINKKGIYHHERLVTGWEGFIKAWLTQDKPSILVLDNRDNFIMMVEYKTPGTKQGFRRKIALANNQDKAEEEVLEAVRYFSNLYKKENSLPVTNAGNQ